MRTVLALMDRNRKLFFKDKGMLDVYKRQEDEWGMILRKKREKLLKPAEEH